MQNSTSATTEKNLSNVIKVDEAQVRQHLGEMVRSTVEETLNAMLDAEADQFCNAQRYEHTESRTDQRADHYKRKLHTKAGQVELKIPKLRRATFETAIIERYIAGTKWGTRRYMNMERLKELKRERQEAKEEAALSIRWNG